MSSRVIGVDHIVPGHEPELEFFRVDHVDAATVALVRDGDAGQWQVAAKELVLSVLEESSPEVLAELRSALDEAAA